jgi:NitT/TauT family transport system permease protein
MSIAAFVTLWWLATWLLKLPAFLLPAPDAVVERLIFLARHADLVAHLGTSASELLFGFVLGSAAGALASSWFFHVPIAERLVSPLIVLVQTSPKIALAPLLVLWMGFGPSSKIVLVAVVVFLPVMAATLSGIRAIPSSAWDLCRILKLSSTVRFLRVELPYALPGIFAGMRIGATQAITAVVIGELLGAKQGLGVLLAMGQENSDAAIVIAIVAVLSLMGYALYLLVGWLERRCLGWHDSRRELQISES